MATNGEEISDEVDEVASDDSVGCSKVATARLPLRTRKRSSHKVGYDPAWTVSRPWLQRTAEGDSLVMMCKLLKLTTVGR